MINLSFGEVTPKVLEVKEKRKINWRKAGKTLVLIYTLYLIASLSIIYVSTDKAVKNMSLCTLEIKKGIDNLLAFNLTVAIRLFENASEYLNEANSIFKRTETLRFTNIILGAWYLISDGEKERLTAINKVFIISEYVANGSQSIVTSLNWTLEAITLAVRLEQFANAVSRIEQANEKALEALNNFSKAINSLEALNYDKLSEKERNATIALNNTLHEMFLLASHLNIISYSMKQLIIAIETSKNAYNEMNAADTNFNDLNTYLLGLSTALDEFEERKINETVKEFFTDLVYCMYMAYKWLLNIEEALRLSIQNRETIPYKDWVLENYTLACAHLTFEYLTRI